MKTEEANISFLKNQKETVLYKEVKDNFFDTDGEWRFVQDEQTKHIWLNPRPAEENLFELYSNYYTHSVFSLNGNSTWEKATTICLNKSYNYPLRFKPTITEKLLSLLPTVKDAAQMEVAKIHSSEKGTLLDFGCGNGFFMEKMFRFGWDVIGFEFDKVAIEKVAKEYGHVVTNSLEELSTLNKKFDIIIMNHVIEHISDPEKTLLDLKKFLNKNGKIIVTTPNGISLGIKIFGKNWRGLEPPRHLNIFTPKSMEVLANKINMNIVITTETRLARGIFFTSALSLLGENKIELKTHNNKNILKFLGYLFQVTEGFIRKINKNSGEEIFCVLSL